MSNVTPIRPVIRERIIIHAQTDEIDLAGKAASVALQRDLPMGTYTFVTFGQKPEQKEFMVRRRAASIVVWSQQLPTAMR